VKKNAFTLIELVAVIVIIGIILAIAVPSITGVISNSTKAAFVSDAKLLLKAIDYKKLGNSSFNSTDVNQSNVADLLGLSSTNYKSIKIVNEENTTILTIIGKGKWDGLVACGTYHNMNVYTSTSECSTDLIPPVITIKGNDPTNIFINGIYSDEGASAVDDKDGDITDKIIVTSNINIYIPGQYSITYYVKDSAGNETTMIRTVNVIDNEGPIITLDPNGNDTYAMSRTIKVNVTDLGGLNNDSLKYLWSSDKIEPTSDLFVISYTNNQNIDTPFVSGSYYLWVKASDLAGNERIISSNVFNLDNEKPVITINGNSTVMINRGTIYSDEGAIVSDNIDKNITIAVTGTVNPNVVGSYIINYNASDAAGNIADTVIRIVNVVDAAAPAITLLGDNPAVVESGATYTDAGATAVDDVDGNVTNKIITTSTVNPNIIGTYYVTYSVVDNAGNTATITRTVNVVDTTSPVISTSLAGSIIFNDPSFVNGSNSLNVYNNLGNGTVTHNRISMSSPTGSGYVIQITTNGSANPELGGFYQIVNSRANGVYFHLIIAKIPIGYKIERASNSIGDGASVEWLTSQAGTGNWQEYIYITRAGSTGSFSTLGHAYLIGPATYPVTWYVAYATMFDTGIWGASNAIALKATDTASGVVGYGINQSSTVPPTFTSITNTKTLATALTNITVNGTYYVWVKDASGNMAKHLVTINYADSNTPTISANAGSYTITQGASNIIPGTYFTINQNGGATITSTTCVDTTNGNVAVTNTSTLAVGTHTIKCTATKSTTLTANATTNIIVNPAYTCSTGTLTYDAGRGGYICVANNPSSSSSCTSRGAYIGSYFIGCYSSPISGSDYTYQIGCSYVDPSRTDVMCPGSYSCGQLTYECGSYSYSYYCPSGWSYYSGSGSVTNCYKAATQQ
jgi:prepilin-type N-terminal cleavage/methylation domain-containing protein